MQQSGSGRKVSVKEQVCCQQSRTVGKKRSSQPEATRGAASPLRLRRAWQVVWRSQTGTVSPRASSKPRSLPQRLRAAWDRGRCPSHAATRDCSHFCFRFAPWLSGVSKTSPGPGRELSPQRFISGFAWRGDCISRSRMAEPVYQTTTVADRGKEGTFCAGQRHLKLPRLAVKVLELVLSFVAFLCEELVEHCEQCGGLYFFEFVSCTAFLLCIVAMVAYCTKIADKITLPRLQYMDVWFTIIVGILFVLASIIFASTNTGSHIEKTAFAFGFLASFTFVADFVILWKEEGARFCKPQQREAAAPAQPAENVALNERSEA